MYKKALQERDNSLEKVTTWEQFTAALEKKHLALAPWQVLTSILFAWLSFATMPALIVQLPCCSRVTKWRQCQ